MTLQLPQPAPPESSALAVRPAMAYPLESSCRPDPGPARIRLTPDQARLFAVTFPQWLFEIQRDPTTPFPLRPRLRRDLGPDALRLFLSFHDALAKQMSALRTRLINVRERSLAGDIMVAKRKLNFDEMVFYMMQEPINPQHVREAAARTRRGDKSGDRSIGAEFADTLMAAMPQDWGHQLVWVRSSCAGDPWEVPRWHTLWDQRNDPSPSPFDAAWKQYTWQSAIWAFDAAYDALRLEIGFPLGEGGRPVDEPFDVIVRDFVLRIREPRVVRPAEPDAVPAPAGGLPSQGPCGLLEAGDGGTA
ncbi:MAG: hypothetical protein ACP5O1_08010 [Phycisphaerae bacterium]